MYYKSISYGCQMNIHESEKIDGILETLGYTRTEETDNADIIVFNTCCIRDTAERRALGNIGAVKPLKKKNKDLIVVVLGCMPEQKGYDEIFKTKYPFVDIVLGTGNLDLLKEKILAKRAGKKRQYDTVSCDRPISEDVPMTRTSFPNAWVNIMYGCNNFCSYCIVPYVRGRERSRKSEDILAEVKALLADGYKEITLLGQNVNSYNNDNKGDLSFAELLRAIGNMEGKFRVRFMTSHPKDLNEDVIKAIAECPNICKNVHLPVQAGSNAVLKNMNRRYTREHYLQLIALIRKYMPDAGITTDIMVGFPEETEEDFADTMALVREVRYSNAFTFIYSMRKGTKAVEMKQVDYAVKRRRIAELIKLQNKITKEISDTYVGKIYEVLVEDVAPKYEGCVCGRTDCGRLVTFLGDASLIGKFVNVEISASKSASLMGNIIE